MPASTRPPPRVTKKSWTGLPRCGMVITMWAVPCREPNVVHQAEVNDVGVRGVELLVPDAAQCPPDGGLHRGDVTGLAGTCQAPPRRGRTPRGADGPK